MKNYYLSILFIYTVFSSINLSAQNQSALDFDGIDDGIRLIGGSQLAAGSSELSMACWVKLNNATANFPDYDGIVGLRDESSADFFMLQLTPTKIESRFRNSNGTAFTIAHEGGFEIGVWQHLLLTYDGSMLRYFINANQVDSVSASGSLGSSNGDFFMGFLLYQTSRYSLLGQLDEVGLWNRKLNSDEISCIYSTKISPASPGLLAYFDFEDGAPYADNTSVLAIQNEVNTGDGIPEGFAFVDSTSNIIQGNNHGINTAVVQSGNALIAQNISGTYQWINCTTNQLIPGAINQSYTPNVNGSYAALITQCGISDTSACFTINNVGLDDLEMDSEMIMFPNPANSQVSIKLSSPVENYSVQIFNMLGELVCDKSLKGNDSNAFDLSEFTSGAYWVEIQSGYSIWKKKLIVLHN
jgi:hypothetical protein